MPDRLVIGGNRPFRVPAPARYGVAAAAWWWARGFSISRANRERKVRRVGGQRSTFHGFTNPVDPSPAELRAWAYQPDSVPPQSMPPDWDLLVTGDRLISTLFDLAMDRSCPARRFALHCLYIYAADGIRTKFKAHPRRKLRKMVQRAEQDGDEQMVTWAHNSRVLLAKPDLFDYHDWCEGGLVRQPRRLA